MYIWRHCSTTVVFSPTVSCVWASALVCSKIFENITLFDSAARAPELRFCCLLGCYTHVVQVECEDPQHCRGRFVPWGRVTGGLGAVPRVKQWARRTHLRWKWLMILQKQGFSVSILPYQHQYCNHCKRVHEASHFQGQKRTALNAKAVASKYCPHHRQCMIEISRECASGPRDKPNRSLICSNRATLERRRRHESALETRSLLSPAPFQARSHARPSLTSLPRSSAPNKP
jgi:hypothetical protein